MLKKSILLITVALSQLFAEENNDHLRFVFNSDNVKEGNKIVTATKRIYLTKYPNAFNPSIIKYGLGYLLSFRYNPDLNITPSLAHIGILLLDSSFNVITEPQLLSTRSENSKTFSQSEDARLFTYRGRTFLIYNDNLEIVYPNYWDRRDMFISELILENNRFVLSSPIKLVYEEKYNTQWWQKNWVPFEWNKTLLMTYSIDPHEIIYPNLMNGSCYQCYKTSPEMSWDFGTLRGSTPPLLVDGEYLAFFHSGIIMTSPTSWSFDLWHYYMGAYTFSAEPPFKITKMTPLPIIADGFYTECPYYKRVIFPGGFVVSGSTIYMAYGKDDREIWIATIDKAALKKAMVPIN